MQIRKATLSEAKAVCELVTLAANDLISKGFLQWPKGYGPIEDIILAIKNGEVFVAVEGKTIVGCVTLNHSFSEEYSFPKWKIKDNNPLAVHRLTVHPAHQRKGIGKVLMNFAEDYARKEKSKSIRFATCSRNPPANDFYITLGYSKVGTIKFTDWIIQDEYNCYEKKV